MTQVPYYPPPDSTGPWSDARIVSPPPPKPSKKNRTGLIIALVVLGAMLCVAGSLLVGAFGNDGPKSGAVAATTPAAARATTAKKGAPPKAAAASVKVGAGEYQVGKDIQAGTYVTPGAEKASFQFCSWTVKASDDSDAEYLDVGSSQGATEAGRVKLKDGQIFDSKGCKDWVKQ